VLRLATSLLMLEAQESGSWDSIHIVEVHENKASKPRSAHYKLTSTVLLHLIPSKSQGKLDLDLSGSLTRQQEQDAVLDTSGGAGEIGAHIENLGKLVEEVETRLRGSLQVMSLSKPTHQVRKFTLASRATLSTICEAFNRLENWTSNESCKKRFVASFSSVAACPPNELLPEASNLHPTKNNVARGNSQWLVPRRVRVGFLVP